MSQSLSFFEAPRASPRRAVGPHPSLESGDAPEAFALRAASYRTHEATKRSATAAALPQLGAAPKAAEWGVTSAAQVSTPAAAALTAPAPRRVAPTDVSTLVGSVLQGRDYDILSNRPKANAPGREASLALAKAAGLHGTDRAGGVVHETRVEHWYVGPPTLTSPERFGTLARGDLLVGGGGQQGDAPPTLQPDTLPEGIRFIDVARSPLRRRADASSLEARHAAAMSSSPASSPFRIVHGPARAYAERAARDRSFMASLPSHQRASTHADTMRMYARSVSANGTSVGVGANVNPPHYGVVGAWSGEGTVAAAAGAGAGATYTAQDVMGASLAVSTFFASRGERSRSRSGTRGRYTGAGPALGPTLSVLTTTLGAATTTAIPLESLQQDAGAFPAPGEEGSNNDGVGEQGNDAPAASPRPATSPSRQELVEVEPGRFTLPVPAVPSPLRPRVAVGVATGASQRSVLGAGSTVASLSVRSPLGLRKGDVLRMVTSDAIRASGAPAQDASMRAAAAAAGTLLDFTLGGGIISDGTSPASPSRARTAPLNGSGRRGGGGGLSTGDGVLPLDPLPVPRVHNLAASPEALPASEGGPAYVGDVPTRDPMEADRPHAVAQFTLRDAPGPAPAGATRGAATTAFQPGPAVTPRTVLGQTMSTLTAPLAQVLGSPVRLASAVTPHGPLGPTTAAAYGAATTAASSGMRPCLSSPQPRPDATFVNYGDAHGDDMARRALRQATSQARLDMIAAGYTARVGGVAARNPGAPGGPRSPSPPRAATSPAGSLYDRAVDGAMVRSPPRVIAASGSLTTAAFASPETGEAPRLPTRRDHHTIETAHERDERLLLVPTRTASPSGRALSPGPGSGGRSPSPATRARPEDAIAVEMTSSTLGPRLPSSLLRPVHATTDARRELSVALSQLTPVSVAGDGSLVLAGGGGSTALAASLGDAGEASALMLSSLMSSGSSVIGGAGKVGSLADPTLRIAGGAVYDALPPQPPALPAYDSGLGMVAMAATGAQASTVTDGRRGQAPDLSADVASLPAALEDVSMGVRAVWSRAGIRSRAPSVGAAAKKGST